MSLYRSWTTNVWSIQKRFTSPSLHNRNIFCKVKSKNLLNRSWYVKVWIKSRPSGEHARKSDSRNNTILSFKDKIHRNYLINHSTVTSMSKPLQAYEFYMLKSLGFKLKKQLAFIFLNQLTFLYQVKTAYSLK